MLFLADVAGASSYHVGDEAMLEANITLFRALLPGCCIEVAAGPGWDGDRLEATVLPRLEFSRESGSDRDRFLQQLSEGTDSVSPAVRAALNCDALIISGGGNLSCSWPHHLYERLAMARIAASKGKPVILLGQTLGPDLCPRERELLSELLQLSQWTGLRERDSSALALELGADPGKLSYQLDDAVFLSPERVQSDLNGIENRPWIAVTVHPLGAPSVRNPIVARLASHLRSIAKAADADLVFLPHVEYPPQTSPVSDGEFGEAIARALYGNPGMRINPVLQASRTLWLTQQASLVISTRYHPIVFALAGAVPAIGIWSDDYTRRKLRGALVHAERPDDAMDLSEAFDGGLVKKAMELWNSRKIVKEELRGRVELWRRDEKVRTTQLGNLLKARLRKAVSVG